LRAQPRQDRVRQRLGGGDSQAAGELLIATADFAIEGQQLRFHAFGGARGAFSRRGELIAARRAVEEPDTQTCFERVQPAEHRGQVDVEALGRASERSFARQREDERQVGYREGSVVCRHASQRCSCANAFAREPLETLPLAVLAFIGRRSCRF
jgi:hypothetical protein